MLTKNMSGFLRRLFITLSVQATQLRPCVVWVLFEVEFYAENNITLTLSFTVAPKDSASSTI
jgi:hypothetical protein